jgi:hypothetical protein
MTPIPWLYIALAFVSVGAFAVLYQLHRNKRNTFDAIDLIVDHDSNRASMDKLVLLGLAALSSWVIVDLRSHDQPVETILLGVLAVFIVKRSADKGIEAAMKSKSEATATREIRKESHADNPD